MHKTNITRLAMIAVVLFGLTLFAGCIPPTTVVAPIGVGSTASGVIVAPGQRVRYPLTVTYPRTVSIYVHGQGLDPTVSLYNAVGGRIGFNDDGGQGLDSQLVMPLGPGRYIIEVAGYGTSTGPFTLTVN